jgi:hypothetical protein
MNHEREKFFKDLKERLGSQKATSRYLQELQDHLDDAVEDARMKGWTQKEAEQDAISQVGPATHLASMYRRLFPPSSFQFDIEAAIMSILSIPLYWGAYSFLRGPALEAAMVGETMVFSRIAIFLVTFSIFLLIFLLYYLLTVPRLLRYDPEIPRMRLVTRLMNIPVLLQLYFLFMNMVSDPQGFFSSPSFAVLQVIVFLLIQAMGVAMIFGIIQFTRWMDRREPPRASKEFLTRPLPAWWWRWVPAGIGLMIGLYAIASVMFLYLYEFDQVDPAMWQGPYAIVFQLLGSRMVFDLLAGSLLRMVTAPLIGTVAAPIVMAAIVAVVVLLLVASIALKVASPSDRRRIPWIRCGLVLYLSSFFVMPVFQPRMDWQIPAVNLSESIERAEFGLLYKFSKHMIRQDYRYFVYDIGTSEEGLTVMQSLGREVTLKDLSSIDQLSLSIQKAEASIDRSAMTELPQDLACDNAYEDRGSKEDGWMGWICHTLSYRGHLILKQDDPVLLADVEQSADGRWMLLRFSSGGDYDIGVVYLADLQSVK